MPERRAQDRSGDQRRGDVDHRQRRRVRDRLGEDEGDPVRRVEARALVDRRPRWLVPLGLRPSYV